MTIILNANGLYGDKDYAVQIRPIFADGSSGDWGPSFALVKRLITTPPVLSPIASSPVGVRLSWSGTLDPAFGEQWLVRKFDEAVTENNFDVSGVDLYRGSSTNYADIDLRQEENVYLGVVKIDIYGNRSAVATVSKNFPLPDQTTGITINNTLGGVKFGFDTFPLGDVNRFNIIKATYSTEFTSYRVITRAKTGAAVTLTFGTLNFVMPIVGDVVQVSIGDTRFDGVFTITGVTASTITYIHSVTGTVSSAATTGYVIPTSAGPSEEGIEIYRQESSGTTPGMASVEYSPEFSGEKLFLAFGTEDSYKNRVNWVISTDGTHPLSYGRDLIAQRDAISLSSANNRVSDSVWKYGYVGWAGVHNATTKALTTGGAASTIVIGTNTTDNPDSIRMGIVNGTTPITFGTQSRSYPSLSVVTGTPGAQTLAKPIVDDAFYVAQETSAGLGTIWDGMEDPGFKLGQVWVECSASDVLDDSIATTLPIILDGSLSLEGTFSILPEVWGSVTDFPTATLRMYAVCGEWVADRENSVYDPHYSPLLATEITRSGTVAITGTNRSKSGRVCTLTLDSTATKFPDPGEYITVSTGDTNFDGQFIVATRSSNTITYRTLASATVASTATTVIVTGNSAVSHTPTNKVKTAAVCRLNITFSTTKAIPSPGEYIDVDINDANYDGVNFLVTAVNINEATPASSWIEYTHGTSGNQASTTITGGDKFVAQKISGVATETNLIGEWSISKNTDLGLFDSGQGPTEKTCEWSWIAPEKALVNTLRFAWVLEFDQNIFSQARNGATSLAANTSYVIKIRRPTAWPGRSSDANIGTENEFSNRQFFNEGATFKKDVDIQDSLTVFGDTYIGLDESLPSNLFVNGKTTTGTLDVSSGDLNILDGELYTNGALGLNSNEIYFFGDDYPIITGTAFGGTPTENTINSIMGSSDLTLLTPRWFYIVSWTGSFKTTTNAGANPAQTYVFRLYRWNYVSSVWTRIREVRARAAGASPATSGVSGSMIHSAIVDAATNPNPHFMVTARQLSGNNETLFTDYAGGSATDDNNRLQVIVLPISRDAQGTMKSTSLTTSPATTYTSITNGGGSGTKTTKTATITFTGGPGEWKENYQGTGASAGAGGGDINQGYFSSNKGNQRSAWGFGSRNWSKTGSGDNITAANVVAGSVKILSCQMVVNPTHWYYNSGGTLIVGTHNDSSASAISNYGNIQGKNVDRKRFPFSSAAKKEIDLGPIIGADIWNGHVINHLWSGGGTAKTTPGGNAKGIIFGPGPNTSPNYYAAIAPADLKITMKVQWKE